MYLRTVYLFSFSLLISFYFIVCLKKIIISPESALENALYELCSPLIIDSKSLHLDFEVKMHKRSIYIHVLGLTEDSLFKRSADEIHKKIKRKAIGRNIIVSFVNNHSEYLYTQNYSKELI